MALNYSISMLSNPMKPGKLKSLYKGTNQSETDTERAEPPRGQSNHREPRRCTDRADCYRGQHDRQSARRRTGGFRRTGKVPSSNHQPRS